MRPKNVFKSISNLIVGIIQVVAVSSTSARRCSSSHHGVYTGPGKIDIAMDLSQPVSWMEASVSMPMVMKDSVIEAFQSCTSEEYRARGEWDQIPALGVGWWGGGVPITKIKV